MDKEKPKLKSYKEIGFPLITGGVLYTTGFALLENSQIINADSQVTKTVGTLISLTGAIAIAEGAKKVLENIKSNPNRPFLTSLNEKLRLKVSKIKDSGLIQNSLIAAISLGALVNVGLAAESPGFLPQLSSLEPPISAGIAGATGIMLARRFIKFHLMLED